VYNNFASFEYTEETPEEVSLSDRQLTVQKKVPKLLTHYRRLDLKGSAIVSKDTFLSNWAEFTQVLFMSATVLIRRGALMA
jgi:hypothetical protein